MDGQYAGQGAWSDVGQTTAEWGVDLGGGKNIHHVVIHHDEGKSLLGMIYVKIKLLSKMNRWYIDNNNPRHQCRLNVNSPSKCKSCIMCERLKSPDIPIHLILIKRT